MDKPKVDGNEEDIMQHTMAQIHMDVTCLQYTKSENNIQRFSYVYKTGEV